MRGRSVQFQIRVLLIPISEVYDFFSIGTYLPPQGRGKPRLIAIVYMFLELLGKPWTTTQKKAPYVWYWVFVTWSLALIAQMRNNHQNYIHTELYVLEFYKYIVNSCGICRHLCYFTFLFSSVFISLIPEESPFCHFLYGITCTLLFPLFSYFLLMYSRPSPSLTVLFILLIKTPAHC